MAEKEVSGSTPGSTIIVNIPAPRRFSVRAVSGKLRDNGFMKAVREKLIELDVYEMFVGANYLLETDPDFVNMKTVVQEITGINGDEFEEMLAECIWKPDNAE